MDLELEGEEVPVGTFSADLVLRDTNTSQRVVVENLLETTDHGHLGKLITYARAGGLNSNCWAAPLSKLGIPRRSPDGDWDHHWDCRPVWCRTRGRSGSARPNSAYLLAGLRPPLLL